MTRSHWSLYAENVRRLLPSPYVDMPHRNERTL